MKKVILGIFFVAILVVGYVVLAGGSENSKAMVYYEEFSAFAKGNNSDCSYAGFAKSRKTGTSYVFTSCTFDVEPDAPFETEQDMMDFINGHVVSKNLSATPREDNVLLVVIVGIQEDIVLCSVTNNGKLQNTYFDSYDNYCMP